jgi:endonuclease/exonuclease/phosphatase family metal-dependent hydrolase
MNRFRVLQFNMQFGQVWDETRPDDAPVLLDATVAEVKAHQADIILLQEVERALPGGTQANPPPNYGRLCSELKGYHGYFAYPKADARELPFGVGLAIFSRTPLREMTRVDLPSPPIEFEFRGRKTTPTDRLLIGARTTIGDHDLQLFNTHLLAFFMLGSSSADNREQRNLVAQQLAEATGPTLLAGDFNVRGHRALEQQFSTHGFATVQDQQITWRRQPFILDHIFYNRSLRSVSHRVAPSMASDHHALIAEFEFVG